MTVMPLKGRPPQSAGDSIGVVVLWLVTLRWVPFPHMIPLQRLLGMEESVNNDTHAELVLSYFRYVCATRRDANMTFANDVHTK